MGKASSLGLKPVPDESSSNLWCELPMPKCPSIVHCATGHEGQHAILVDVSGAAYFVGLARRGEDGDLCKYILKVFWMQFIFVNLIIFKIKQPNIEGSQNLAALNGLD